jgi:WD40 repeat protein
MPETPSPDEAIFAAAIAMAPEQRAAYLDEACGADGALRGRVEGLLRSHDDAGSFLDKPPLPTAATGSVPATEPPGAVIGRYKLLQAIGEGGFGVVYMAEQKEPVRRRVALKVIKLGMDSKEVMARFEAERQALALMDHPNIAKVFDAGATTTGRPYFVMELVKGVPLVEFCDTNQLPARDRLAIFMAVCLAVQHAHQKGIIHRDLKPSNVLVTLHDGKPVAKVIDFGVAKAINQELTEKTLFTAFGQMMGTPQYMSPEQAEMSGLDVDTRSDIYSLGVVLYELLTGTTPLEAKRLRSAGYAEVQRLIREEEAQRPSLRLSTLGERLSVVAKDRQCGPKDLQRLLRGELDWIVMKALEKDRTRRYETATALGKDVDRYLTGDAVEACPPSAAYRMRKFARKYRKGLAVAAAFFLLLVVAVAISSWQAVRATLAEGDATEKSNALAGAESQVRAERDDARDARDKLRQSLYATRANLIHAAWGSDNMGRVLHLLEQQRPQPGEPDLRGFEWHYYHRLVHADLRTLDFSAELSSAIMGTMLSPDGSRFAAVTLIDKGEPAARVRVWALATGKEVFSARADFGIARLSFSRDGTRFALTVNPMVNSRPTSGGGRREVGRLVVWDCDTGKELFTASPNPVYVALSSDGRRVAAVFQKGLYSIAGGVGPAPPEAKKPPGRTSFAQEVKVWEVDTGKEIGIFRDVEPQVAGLTFSPDSDELVASLGSLSTPVLPRVLRLWEVGGEQRWTTTVKQGLDHVKFSPDGTRLACSSVGNYLTSGREKYELKLFGAANGKELSAISAPGAVRNATFSPDGKLLAGGAGPNLQVYDVAGKELWTLKGHTALVTDVAFSADGSRVVSLDSTGVVKVWATPTLVSEPAPKGAVAITPDGTYRLSFTLSPFGGGGGFGIGFGPGVVGAFAAPSPAAGVNVIKVFDGAGKLLNSFEGHAAGITQVQFSPDSRYVVSSDLGSPGKTSKTLVWEVATGKQRLSLDGGYPPTFSASSNRMAAKEESRGELKVWDTKDFKQRFSLPINSLPPGTFSPSTLLSPDGRRLLVRGWQVGPANQMQPVSIWELWDVDGARLIARLPSHENRAFPNYALSAFDAVSRRVAVIDGTDITVWDAITGSQLITLRGTKLCAGIVMSADGALVAALPGTSSGHFRAPGTILEPDEAPEGVPIWDVAARKVLYRLQTSRVLDVAFSPDGRRIASLAAGFGPDRLSEVKLWDTATGAELMELKSEILARKLTFSADGTRLTVSVLGSGDRSFSWDARPLPEK